MDAIYCITMKPFSFKLPIARFDLNLLPVEARQIGSEAFKTAVVAYFSNQYAGKGESAVVMVDDEEISVVTLPSGTDPLDFVMTMLQGGQIKEAIPYLEGMARAMPSNAQVFYNLGIAYSELGEFDQAIIRLKRAVQLQPEHAHAWTGLGVAYQRMGKAGLALEPFQNAVEAEPGDGYVQRNLGGYLAGSGQLKEALVHLRLASRALPNDPQATYGLAQCLEQLGEEDGLAEADELYQVVIERWPASNVAEPSRKSRTGLAHRNMRGKVFGGLRPDAVMYIADALDTFKKWGPQKCREITVEVALLGQNGLDINDATQKYTLKSLHGKFSGMHLVCIMYAGFKELDPTLDAGIDLKAEYEAALAMQRKGS